MAPGAVRFAGNVIPESAGRIGSRVVLGLLLFGCAAPVMLDLDGRPITHPAQVAMIESGWLVIDSASEPPRATLELAFDAGEQPSDRGQAPNIALRLADGTRLSPARILVGPMVCTGLDPRSQYCAARPSEGPVCRDPSTGINRRCFRALRAEVLLPHVPSADAQLTLDLGPRQVDVRWTRPKAAPHTARAQVSYRPPTPVGLDEYYPVPDDNPLTREKIALGERLFFDPLLSGDSTVACASCHQPARAFSDSLSRSVGVRGLTTQRNAPTILNRAYGTSLFWDGRAASLEQAVVQPIQNPAEMNLPLPALVERLRASQHYRTEFASTFPDRVTAENLARALASYVRSLRSGNAAIDRFLHGDRGALSPEAQAGMRMFNGRANCVACHVGPTFADEKFHNTGVSWGTEDVGRHAVTGSEEDRGVFKTPSLRNVALTAPYMHDGSFRTLDEVVEFYNRGANPNPHLDPEIKPLRLTAEEQRQLVAFLRALTGRP